jgi:hypothetical protein
VITTARNAASRGVERAVQRPWSSKPVAASGKHPPRPVAAIGKHHFPPADSGNAAPTDTPAPEAPPVTDMPPAAEMPPPGAHNGRLDDGGGDFGDDRGDDFGDD